MNRRLRTSNSTFAVLQIFCFLFCFWVCLSFFLPSPSVTVWSALIGQDLNCHMTMFSKFLCMPELLFKAFCLFYWWTVYLRHDPCDDKDFNNKDSLPGGPAGSIGRSNPHVNFFFLFFFLTWSWSLPCFLLVTVGCISPVILSVGLCYLK